jgi:hypothetical protein
MTGLVKVTGDWRVFDTAGRVHLAGAALELPIESVRQLVAVGAVQPLQPSTDS